MTDSGPGRVVRWLAAAASAVLAVLTALLIAVTVERARLPYENGRFFDPVDSVVYDEGAVPVYGLLALALAVVTAVACWATLRLWHGGRAETDASQRRGA